MDTSKKQQLVRSRLAQLFVPFLVTIMVPAQVVAQQSEAGSAFRDSGSLLEEVTVTARKREESVMSVPISILVASGEALREQSITRLEGLSATVPSFHFSEAVSANDQIFMRGIGSGVNFGFENSVGQVFDGIFIGRSRFGRSLFMDLAQIEILKGPQGAVIGKNTTAGAINIRSNRPTSELEGYLVSTLEFEGDEGYSIEGALSGPLSEKVRGRVAFRTEDFDGYVKNITRNKKEMSRNNYDLRGTLEFDITQNMNATLMYQRGNQQREGRGRELLNCSPTLEAQLEPTGEDCKFNRTNSEINLRDGVEEPATTDTKTDLAGLTLNWSTPVGNVTSITGYSKYETTDAWDGDLTAFEGTSLNIDENYHQWSEELRLTSDSAGKLDYIVGLYYLTTDLDAHFKINANLQGPPPLPTLPPSFRVTTHRVFAQGADTVAAFGQVTLHVTDQISLTGGARATHEEKSGHHEEYPTEIFTDTPVSAPAGGPGANVHDIRAKRVENDITSNVVLEWRPISDSLLYVSASSGFKGGGFDGQLSAPQAVAKNRFEYEDERVAAYEIGGKFSFPDSGVQVTAAVFHAKFKDLQVSSLLPGEGTLFRVGNAASAISEGVEASVLFRPNHNLRISAAATYLKARYDDYADAPCYGAQTVGDGCVNGLQDLTGKELQYSPKLKATADGQYTWPLANDLEVSLFARVSYSDSFAFTNDLDPKSFQDSYAKIDSSLSIGSGDGKWRISFVGQNLTDKLTANFGNSGAGPAGSSVMRFAEPPRAYVLQARVAF